MNVSAKKTFTAITAIALTCLVTSVWAGQRSDIVDTAVSAGSFKTLAAALEAADLVGALKGDGPFTVFAPTDEAFAKLPAGTVEALLKPENKDQLTAILTYHVVAGAVPAKQVVGLNGAKTLNGQRVDIAVSGSSVKVDSANVIKTDIACSNGIIHVIDSVLLPSEQNLVETASSAGNFQTLIAAAKAAGLAGALTGDGPLTVFAPTDDAFAKLPAGTVESLLKPENKGKLAAILKYHVVAGRVYSEDALAAKRAETLQGAPVRIGVVDGQPRINRSNLVATDIDASNGVIHVIDAVLLPPEKSVDSAEARHMIEHAVSRGARLFNSGHHSACAALYMTTMQEMVDYGNQMPEEIVAGMREVMSTAQHTSCPTARSWALRHGLDSAYARMAERP